jgi:hypothetical protein
MALYKDGRFVKSVVDAVFDEVHPPGTPAPRSGIYRCVGCGREASSTESHPLPPQNHHEHHASQGRIRWQLLVYANHLPSA